MKKSPIRNHAGFTLVELIITIAIIAVLASVLTPQYIKYVAKSKQAVCDNNIHELERAYLTELILNENPVTALNTVMADAGLSKVGSLSDLKYTGGCSEDGVYTFTLDGNTITKVTCSKHGQQALSAPTDSDGAQVLQSAFANFYTSYLKDYLASNPGVTTKHMDSNGVGVVNSFRPYVEEALTSAGYQMTDTTIWRVSWQNGQVKIYWADPGEKMTLDSYTSNITGKQINLSINDLGNATAGTVLDSNIQIGKRSNAGETYLAIMNSFTY